jgi:hypothetical protein
MIAKHKFKKDHYEYFYNDQEKTNGHEWKMGDAIEPTCLEDYKLSKPKVNFTQPPPLKKSKTKKTSESMPNDNNANFFCDGCGTKITSSAKFCFSCGKKIDQSSRSNTSNLAMTNDDRNIFKSSSAKSTKSKASAKRNRKVSNADGEMIVENRLNEEKEHAENMENYDSEADEEGSFFEIPDEKKNIYALRSRHEPDAPKKKKKKKY